MPRLYDKLGIRFQYPDNWMLDETEAGEGELEWAGREGRSITVYSPHSAFWTVITQSDPDLRSSVEAVLDALRDEYAELDAEAVTETVAGHALAGYDVNFVCLDLTNTALIRAVETASLRMVILCQSEDRELEEVARVFQAMTTSLLAGA